MDFGGFTTRVQLRANVFGPGVGLDAGRCDGLERAGRRIAFHGILVRIGDHGVNRRIMDRSIVDIDGGRCGALCGVDEHYRRAS